MSNSVLCAVDINEPEQEKNVIKTAARLAGLDGAQLDVVTVVPDFGMSVVGTFFSEDHHDKAVGKAKELLSECVTASLGSNTDLEVRHIVATGTVYEQILNTAEKTGASLIVIGAHKPDFKDYLLGPNAARVVRHSTCSVHVVRE